MRSDKGTLVLLIFCVILGISAVAFVVRSSPAGPGLSKTFPDRGLRAEEAKREREAGGLKEEPQVPSPPPAVGSSAGRVSQESEGPPPPDEGLETGEKPNPKLILPPVEEPAMPLDEKEGEKFNYIPLPNNGGFIFERPGPDGKPIGGVVVPGHVLVRRGVVELFGCAEFGKAHETIVMIETDIQSLDTALTLAGLRRGPLPRHLGKEDPRQGSRVIVLVQWENKDGKTVTYRSEDLVVSLKRGATMPRVGWTYVGRWTEVEDAAAPPGGRRQRILACTGTRSLVTTFRDRTALLDNPLPEAEDDTQFAANYMLLPKSGTPVRIIFRPPVGAELAEIAEVEKEVVKAPVLWKPDDREHDHEEKRGSYYDRLKGPGGTPLPEKKEDEEK